jgi:hypothetical protein
MKVESYFLLFLSACGAVFAALYWFLSKENSGSVMLVATCLLGLLPGSYYLWWSRRMTPRAEDSATAEPADGAGIVGAFPSTSIWPFVIGVSALMVGLSLIFGVWSAVVGLSVSIIGVFGVISESRHGGASRR